MEATNDIEGSIIDAIRDPDYHRAVFCKSPLFWPQVQAVRLVEKHMDSHSGKTITIRSSRQTMKNECAATIHSRALVKYRDKGGIIIRTAPTHKPQIVNSKMRLEHIARSDPFLRGRLKSREGYIYENGEAQIQFLSAQDKANVEGATASLLLDIDEAHKVDKGKFEEAFAPMAAWAAVPTVMWGVAADKEDLLYEYRQFNEDGDPELNLQFPCDIWCELRLEYATHIEERKRKLGEDHPVFLTQYRLIDIETTAGYLKPYQIEEVMSSDHQRLSAPKDGSSYVAVIDIGGEDDEGETTKEKGDAGRDATICWIAEVDHSDRKYDYPMFRIVQGHYWVGKIMGQTPDGGKGQQEILLDILNRWKVKKAVVDARGLGTQIASYLKKRYAGLEDYSATSDSVSDDCYGLLALINNGRLKMWQNDQSDEWKELLREMKHTKYEIQQHDRMKIAKPPSGGHIDMVKAITYLTHCTKKPFVMRTY